MRDTDLIWSNEGEEFFAARTDLKEFFTTVDNLLHRHHCFFFASNHGVDLRCRRRQRVVVLLSLSSVVSVFGLAAEWVSETREMRVECERKKSSEREIKARFFFHVGLRFGFWVWTRTRLFLICIYRIRTCMCSGRIGFNPKFGFGISNGFVASGRVGWSAWIRVSSFLFNPGYHVRIYEICEKVIE